MVAVLVTGRSGAGRSTALAGLARRGFATVDTDDGDWTRVVDGEPLRRPERIDALLALPRTVPLFVQGTVANQGRWCGRFDAVVLLTAPLHVLLRRVATRADNPFGRTEADRRRIRRDTAEVEPLLRASATHVVDTTAPPVAVVERLERIAATAPDAASDRIRDT